MLETTRKVKGVAFFRHEKGTGILKIIAHGSFCMGAELAKSVQ